jgi:hypothetical protein
VLVEVDKVENLREAYPNYFLDVRLFTQNVLSALNGGKMMYKQDVQRAAYQRHQPPWASVSHHR